MKHLWRTVVLILMLSLLLLPAAAHGEDAIPAGFEPAYIDDQQVGWERSEGGVSAYLYPQKDGSYRLSCFAEGALGAYSSTLLSSSQLHMVDTVLERMEGSFWQRISLERTLRCVVFAAGGAALAVLGLNMAKRTEKAADELAPGPESSRGHTIFRHVRELWMIFGAVMLAVAGTNGLRLVVGIVQLL